MIYTSKRENDGDKIIFLMPRKRDADSYTIIIITYIATKHFKNNTDKNYNNKIGKTLPFPFDFTAVVAKPIVYPTMTSVVYV